MNKVIQSDRDLMASLTRSAGAPGAANLIENGLCDDWPGVQMIAGHRINAQEKAAKLAEFYSSQWPRLAAGKSGTVAKFAHIVDDAVINACAVIADAIRQSE